MKYKPSNSGEIIHKKGYSKRIIFSTKDFQERGYLLQVVTIPSKTKQRLHLHRKQTEVYYILEGEAIIYMNENEFPAKPGDAFICSPGDKHKVWNKSDKDFRLVVFKINIPDEDDTDWLNEEES